jgi:hypothetical protein
LTVNGGLNLDLIECDKETALGINWPLDQQVELASTVHLPSDIAGYRNATAMELVVVPDGKTSFDIPATDAQTVTPRSDGSFVIRVRPVEARDDVAFPYRGDDATVREALQPSDACKCDDPQIVELARSAIGDCGDANQACKKLEQFVWSFITAKMESKDETATAILQHRCGNCRQHAILLATLCRAVGIPAKLVVGLCSNGQNQLGGHDWVQCYIGDRWVDYDAAMQGFDVAHVALWSGCSEEGLSAPSLLAKFGHFSVATVRLEFPWYRRFAWPLGIAGVVGLWLLVRRRRKMKVLRRSACTN